MAPTIKERIDNEESGYYISGESIFKRQMPRCIVGVYMGEEATPPVMIDLPRIPSLSSSLSHALDFRDYLKSKGISYEVIDHEEVISQINKKLAELAKKRDNLSGQYDELFGLLEKLED